MIPITMARAAALPTAAPAISAVWEEEEEEDGDEVEVGEVVVEAKFLAATRPAIGAIRLAVLKEAN